MQGTLREIDIHTIIHLIECGQRTGELLIESSTGKFWFLFFDNGELIYATDTDSNLTRLQDYLHGLGLDHALDRLSSSKLGINVLEYGQIWALLEANILSPDQTKSILEGTIREVLFDIIGLYQGTFVFEISTALTPRLTRFKFSQISSQYSQQLQTWKKFYPVLQSLDQCPILLDREALPHLSAWIDGKTTLRQLTRYTGQDISQIGQQIYDAIALGQVTINPLALSAPQQVKVQSPRILCIDDSVTICRAVEYILHNHGFQVMAVSSPTKALSLIFQHKPDLILCDITMPEIDGYELCGMLRKSSAFAKVPIIMLTGKDGFIDRVKARMVGATEYLTKPFGEKELLTTVEKYCKR
ncbi:MULTISPECIES: response regulator [Pseudanabaena]|uniref:Response regulator receiver protein n=2 Tax=Pseudanabaena TaxID=1152 RepID=L8MZ15_9CYAN|nr:MULTISPECIES: response regulator [Pseudanabaena]ELS31213.1 response regulator receiver protein [Pseudanabaena biceps PCC 7429]MDG3496529.1 response regulator [Pseudanabaena catenata USMAC16]